METAANTRARTRRFYGLILTAALMGLSGIALADDNKRVSVTTQSLKSDPDRKVSRDEYDVLQTVGPRSTSKELDLQSKTGSSESAYTANLDFWFYTADIELFNDHDGDGYFQGIDLLFDADSIYAAADVYAVIYLSLDGGPWNEYAATEDFTIFGATSEDEYIIVTELVSGYPSGSYDVLIELFDAYDNSLLAWFGPDDTSELAFLPLEDAVRDEPVAPLPEVVVVHEGGGAMGWWLLLATVIASVAKRSGLLRPSGSQ